MRVCGCSLGATLAVVLRKAGLYAHYTEVEAPLLEALALADAALQAPPRPPPGSPVPQLPPHTHAQQRRPRGDEGASLHDLPSLRSPCPASVALSAHPLGLVLSPDRLAGAHVDVCVHVHV